MKHPLIIAALLLAGCGAESSLDDLAEVENLLPFGAQNIHEVGNGWVQFDYENNRMLMSPTGGITRVERDMFCEPAGVYLPVADCIASALSTATDKIQLRREMR